jgi:Family of unknown function (DUF5678)
MSDVPEVDMAEVLRQQISAERELSKRLLQYAGEWVAVRNHDVVAHASTLEKLMELVSGTEETVEVFEVSAEPEAVCFF